MSNRYHNKFHRNNHHSDPTAGYPDSTHDPIASQSSPFKGDFVLKGALSASAPLSAYAGYFYSNGKSIISESPSGDNGDINIDEFGNTNVVYPTFTDGYVAVHSQGNVLVDNALSASSLWTNTLYANSAVILVTDMHINELSGFTIIGPDYRQNVPASIDPNTEPLLFLQGIGISGTSWASFEGDIQGNVIYSADGNSLEWNSAYTTVNANSATWGGPTGDCILTDCISGATPTTTAIDIWNNLDMNGYSISGIGADSLAFEYGSKLQETTGNTVGQSSYLITPNTIYSDGSNINRSRTDWGGSDASPFGTSIGASIPDSGDYNYIIRNDLAPAHLFGIYLLESVPIINEPSFNISHNRLDESINPENQMTAFTSGGRVFLGGWTNLDTLAPGISDAGVIVKQSFGSGTNNGTLGVENDICLGSTVFSDSDGDSTEWNSTYTTVLANSAMWGSSVTDLSEVAAASGGWNSTETTVRANSAQWAVDTVFDSSEIEAASGDWNSTYTTVCANSAQWEEGGDLSEIAAASGNWNATYTTVNTNSANWEGNIFSITVGAGPNTLNTTTTATNNGVFYDLTIKDGVNARASQVMATWSDAGVVYTETATTDLGDTSPIVISVEPIGGTLAQLVGTVASGSWTVTGTKRVI